MLASVTSDHGGLLSLVGHLTMFWRKTPTVHTGSKSTRHTNGATCVRGEQTHESKGLSCVSEATRLGDAVRSAVRLAGYRRIGIAIAAMTDTRPPAVA